MLPLRTFLVPENAQLIVINEDLSAAYGKYFVTGCLQQLIKTQGDKHFKLDVLSLSDPTHRCLTERGAFSGINAIVHDCYTLDVSSTATVEDYVERLNYVINGIDRKSTVVIDCLSSLILNLGAAKCFQLLKKITEKSCQLICIHRKEFATGARIPTLVETLGTTYVELSDYPPTCNALSSFDRITYVARIVHRKAGGSTARQTKLLIQSIVTYEIILEKDASAPHIDLMRELVDSGREQDIESSFRIRISDHEMEQKRKTSLPYTFSSNASATSKIIYRPEDIDDVDEEDPDDDLCF